MLLSLKHLLIPETSLAMHSAAGHEREKREHSRYILGERRQPNGNLEEQIETVLLRKELILKQILLKVEFLKPTWDAGVYFYNDPTP